MTLYIQRYSDWERYNEAEDTGKAEPIDPDADAKRYREEIDQALKAEGQGFDSIWTVEHHISPYTMIPNPVQLLTYFAGATSRIDFGTMVVVLPWHDPVLLAERAAHLEAELAQAAATRELVQKHGLPRLVWVEAEYAAVIHEAELGYVRTLIRDIGRCSASAAICPITVSRPCPMAEEPT